MDLGDSDGGFGAGDGGFSQHNRALPDDLPKSLDDRRHVPIELVPETEMYDGWQGACLIPVHPSSTGMPSHPYHACP